MHFICTSGFRVQVAHETWRRFSDFVALRKNVIETLNRDGC
eukprot:COSAG01_NODE_64562_length_276_cov_0.581921_1_plen_40_part_10